MNKTISLQAEKRKTLGHKVKHLRKEGKLPASVYGKGFESISIEIPTVNFKKAYEEAGQTHLVDLLIDGSKHPVLIHAVQQHPVTKEVLHVELLKVNLKEKMKTMIPITIEGEAPAVKEGLGTLIQVLQEIEIEALPSEIPESLVINIDALAVVDSEKTVKDLVVPGGVTVLSDAEETVVKIGAIVVEEEPVSTEAAESEAKEETEETPTTEAASSEESKQE